MFVDLPHKCVSDAILQRREVRTRLESHTDPVLNFEISTFGDLELVAQHISRSGAVRCFIPSGQIAKVVRCIDSKMITNLAGDIRIFYGDVELVRLVKLHDDPEKYHRKSSIFIDYEKVKLSAEITYRLFNALDDIFLEHNEPEEHEEHKD